MMTKICTLLVVMMGIFFPPAVSSSTVTRALPASYTPGVAVTVQISVNPTAGTVAWALEETPPTGWTISAINEDGAWDGVGKKVKWGPFFDASARTLTYQATPPAGESGQKMFSGTASFDGNDLAIGGQSVIDQHALPNLTLSLAKMGNGSVRVNGTPCTLPWSGAFPSGANVTLEAVPDNDWRFANWAGDLAGSNNPTSILMSGNKSVTVNFTPVLASNAIRVLPANYKPEATMPVQIVVSPAAGTIAWALEETPPAGWTISGINEGGAWDGVGKKVKWGPFFDASARTLTYQATPPAGESGQKSFIGTVSYNGNDQTVGGQNTIDPDITAPMVLSITRLDMSPTSNTTVRFKVGFSEAVTGVSIDDFAPTQGGSSVVQVQDGPTIYTITVNTGPDDGALRLDVKASGTGIQDLAGNILAGGFTGGDSYHIDKNAPIFTELMATPPLAKLGTMVTITCTVSEMLQSSPTLMVNGHEATIFAHNGLEYTYAYMVLSSDPENWATIIVSGTDLAGNVGSLKNVTALQVDKTAPNMPIVTGDTPTSDTTPNWSWISGGGGGSGTFRHRLGGEWTETTELSWSAPTSLIQGVHSLEVQERDAAGNWSASGSFAITVDITPPNAPVVTGDTPTSDTTPSWRWTSGGGSGSGTFRFQLDSQTGIWTPTTGRTWLPVTPLGEGGHVLYVQERDVAGNWSASDSFSITVDITSPTPGMATPPIYAKAGSILVSYIGAGDGVGSGLRWVELWFKKDNGAWSYSGLRQATANGSFSFSAAQGLSGNGTYCFDLVAEDQVGNRSAAASGSGDDSTIYDAVAPTAGTVSSPPYAKISPIRVSYTGVADTGGSGLKQVVLWSKKGTGVWADTGLRSSGVTGGFDFVPSGEGSYFFGLVVEDNASNCSATPSGNGDISIIYDIMPPAPGTATPPAYAKAGKIVVPYSGAGETGGSGLKQVELWCKKGSGGWTNSGLTQTGASGSFNFDSNHGLSGDGTYLFDLVAEDNAGNRSASASGDGSTIYDTVAPSKPVFSGDWSTSDTTPTWNWVTGGGGGNGTFRYQLDSQTGTWNQTTRLNFTPSTSLSQGVHTLYVQECDAAGNWSNSGSAKVTVDSTAPQSQITQPDNNTTVTACKITLEWTHSDPNGTGVRLVEIKWSKNSGPQQILKGSPFKAIVTNVEFYHTGKGTYQFYSSATDNVGNTKDLTLDRTINVNGAAANTGKEWARYE